MIIPTINTTGSSPNNAQRPAKPTLAINTGLATPTSLPASPQSPSPTLSARRGCPNVMSLDLSDLPALSAPAPVTNTLLLTNLDNPSLFAPAALANLRSLISQLAPINTWSPLRAFNRIIVSFPTITDAKRVRAVFDGELVMGQRTRVYFGPATHIGPRQDHLALPDAGKLFFISPPPSPPMGWEMRLEDAPNKQVHADDLAEALAKLHAEAAGPADDLKLGSPVSPVDGQKPKMRSRSSTLIWHPEQHGHSADSMIPSIEVVDCEDDDEPVKPKPIMAHTMRPPVELME